MMAAWLAVPRRSCHRALLAANRGVRRCATIAVSTIEENTFLSDRFKTEEGKPCLPFLHFEPSTE